MLCCISELMEKNVINAVTGEKIGNLYDVEVNTDNACLSALLILVRDKTASIIAKSEKVRVEWHHIKVIGKDAILVNCDNEPEKIISQKSFFDKLWN